MDEFEARLEATGRVDTLEEDVRRIGLYLEGWDVAPNSQTPDEFLVVCGFQVGQVAFSDRVQFPERFYTDQTFKVIELDDQVDEFLETRQAIVAALQAGEDPLDL